MVWLAFKTKNDLWWPFTKWCCRHLYFVCSFVCLLLLLFFLYSFILSTGAIGMPNNDASPQTNNMKWTCMAQTEEELACIEVTKCNTKAHATCNIIISQIYVLENNKLIKNNDETKKGILQPNHQNIYACNFCFYYLYCYILMRATSFFRLYDATCHLIANPGGKKKFNCFNGISNWTPEKNAYGICGMRFFVILKQMKHQQYVLMFNVGSHIACIAVYHIQIHIDTNSIWN